MSSQNFFSRFSKKLKPRFVGTGHKPGERGTSVARVTADLRNKGGGGEEGASSTGLPQPDDSEVVQDKREPEHGQSGIDVDEGEVGLVDPTPQLGGEEIPGDKRSPECGGVVVEGEVGPVNPHPQPNPGISLGDQEPSGST